MAVCQKIAKSRKSVFASISFYSLYLFPNMADKTECNRFLSNRLAARCLIRPYSSTLWRHMRPICLRWVVGLHTSIFSFHFVQLMQSAQSDDFKWTCKPNRNIWNEHIWVCLNSPVAHLFSVWWLQSPYVDVPLCCAVQFISVTVIVGQSSGNIKCLNSAPIYAYTHAVIMEWQEKRYKTASRKDAEILPFCTSWSALWRTQKQCVGEHMRGGRMF